MDLLHFIKDTWHIFVLGLTVLMAVLASGHALLFKRDTRGAVLWVGVIWLSPLVGAVLYFIFGVNRIRRHAKQTRGRINRLTSDESAPAAEADDIAGHLGADATTLLGLVQTVNSITPRRLLLGNQIEVLVNGDEAIPAMVKAIEQARTSVTFATYILDHGRAGTQFLEALTHAVRRGVEVRVLIDDTGSRYSRPNMATKLREAGIPVARFMPTFAPFRLMALNLRNHRKILVVDGRIGFTGGMNIRDGHLLRSSPTRPVQDLHFKVEGPVVAHLRQVFAEDWRFTTDEALTGEAWFPPLARAGRVISRGIADGPDDDFDNMRLTILGALSAARKQVTVVTPYFLPDGTLIAALNLAAMRGVRVDILLPAQNNLPFVQWASTAHLWQVLERGCKVWFTPPPFDHSKLLIVDGQWSLIGSANWDPRSLRLNFELNLECYDRDLAARLDAIVEARLQGATPVTLADVDSRPLAVKLRDGIARLFTPYL